MKSLVLKFMVFTALCLGITSSCSSSKEPEITKMDMERDSLEKSEKEVAYQIEKVQQSLRDIDKEFQN
jgi:TolA-binding protein